MTHPSMDGLREALFESIVDAVMVNDIQRADVFDRLLQAQADYLEEHDVVLSANDLVRIEYVPPGRTGSVPYPLYRIVPSEG